MIFFIQKLKPIIHWCLTKKKGWSAYNNSSLTTLNKISLDGNKSNIFPSAKETNVRNEWKTVKKAHMSLCEKVFNAGIKTHGNANIQAYTARFSYIYTFQIIG